MSHERTEQLYRPGADAVMVSPAPETRLGEALAAAGLRPGGAANSDAVDTAGRADAEVDGHGRRGAPTRPRGPHLRGARNALDAGHVQRETAILQALDIDLEVLDGLAALLPEACERMRTADARLKLADLEE